MDQVGGLAAAALHAGHAASHYSNIGYDILGLIAARAAGKPLPVLYRELIFEPLGLHATAYDPQGPISGAHAHGYGIEPGGTDRSTRPTGTGASAQTAASCPNAEDTATFLTALMRGKLLDREPPRSRWKADDLWRGGEPTGCAGQAYGWSGGGSGYKTEVWVDDGGRRVAVLLLDARHYDTAQPAADLAAHSHHEPPLLRRLTGRAAVYGRAALAPVTRRSRSNIRETIRNARKIDRPAARRRTGPRP